MSRILPLAVALFSIPGFAVDPQPGTTSSAKIRDPYSARQTQLSNGQKAAAYDEWPERQKVGVSNVMGRQLGKLTGAELTAAIATMTEQEKVDAYDFYVTHDKKALRKTIERSQ